MKIRYLLISTFSVAIGLCGLILLFSSTTVQKYQPRDNKISKEIGGIDGAIEWLSQRRVNPLTGKIEFADVLAAEEQISRLRNTSKEAQSALSWIEMGPDNIGGRTRAILVDKNNPKTIFAGGVSGGLWKSTNEGISWAQVSCTGDNNSTGIDGTDIITNIIVSSICQTPNGEIYFGTGESFMGGSGLQGQGIWKSSNGGASFSRLASTWNDAASKTAFSFVNELAADPNNSNRIYAATVQGLRMTTDGGTTWVNPVPLAGNLGAEDVKVGRGGAVIASYTGAFHYIYRSTNGNVDSFVKDTVSTSANRQEFAFSPEDENYVYCLASKSNGNMLGVYKSVDKGATWSVLGNPGTSTFNILGNQGTYDNVIAVFPNDKNKIICGGQSNLWIYNQAWEAVSEWSISEMSSAYVHSDHHVITFHPTQPNTFYVGTDGGIFKSNDGGHVYTQLNKKYNVTQFYAVGFSGDGRVLGGTQDNGTPYCDFTGNTSKTFTQVRGGDGGYCEISTLVPEITFATIYYGSLGRGDAPGQFFDGGFEPNPNPGASFITPIALWESYNDSLSTDSVKFKADRNYSAGDVVHVMSKMNKRDLVCTLSKPLLKDSTIQIQDKFQAVLAIGMKDNVYITRKPLDLSTAIPAWYPTGSTSGKGIVTTLAFSKDGNYIYFTTGYNLYRSSNINYSRTAAQMNGFATSCTIRTEKIADFNGIVTSIAVDPNNGNNVIATLGGYNNSGGKIYYSNNATWDAPYVTFTAKDNFVFPVYASLILLDDYKKALIGTEYGIYGTDDITAATPVWTNQNGSMGNVPVYMIRQQTIPNNWITGVKNNGYIYAASFGRGIWRCETYKGPVGIEDNMASVKALQTLTVYPNPAQGNTHVSLELSKASDITLNIYNMQGKMVKTLTLQRQGIGHHSYPINISELEKGNYILNAISNGQKATTKFMIY